jgi:serine phosphatase RsbU (regulator of sigma subunit)
MAGPVLQRAERYDLEHDIADTLQLSILARPSVALPDVRWSVLYRAGSAGLAGGDWYDLFALDDHRLAIAMGDVVGQGVQAAAVMGQLRSAIRAMGVLIGDPGSLVAAADDYVRTTGHGEYSSMTYIVLDTRTGELHHAVAGHPPPLLRLPDGSTELLTTGRGPLLGIDGERATATRHIERGTLLLLYTDGLVERRGESVDVGLARLEASVAAAPVGLEPEELCSTVASQLLPPNQAVDDVAIVAVELAG